MNKTAINRIVAALVCALLGDIPVAIVSIYIYELNQLGTIAWVLISAGLFALYMRFFERRKPNLASTDSGRDP
jgi:hypothetical protein